MREEFANALLKFAVKDKRLILLTGDVGFNLLERIGAKIGSRYINTGVSEQNMVSVAGALASEGLRVVCYSFTPFLAYRAYEQLKLDVCLPKRDVKLVGIAPGYFYGSLGATHHAIEDIAVLTALPNIRYYAPFCNEDVEGVVEGLMRHKGPSFLSIGRWPKPEGVTIPRYAPIRRLANGEAVTIVAIGQVIGSAFAAIRRLEDNGDKRLVDLFVVSELPLLELSQELKESLKKTKKLIVLEEHVERGGLGEHLARLLLKEDISCRFTHLHAKGYPNGLYGSQEYHYGISGIDENSVTSTIRKLVNG